MEMDFESVCRTCLGTKSLNPIFKNVEHHKLFSVAIMNTTGLEVRLLDGLPQKICIDCMMHINISLKFRAQCKKARTKLLQMFIRNPENTNTIGTFDDDRDNISNEKSEEAFIKAFGIKTETELCDNDISITDLFDNETENAINNNFEKTGADKDYKVLKVMITENIVVDKTFNKLKNDKEKSSDKCKINTDNTILNELKIEDSELQKKNKVTCGICNKNLSIRSVDAHMSKRHPGADIRKNKCEFCDTYVLKIKMDRHLRMIHGKDNSICRYCKLKFAKKEFLIEHVSTCTEKNRKRSLRDSGKEISECEICHKKMQKASLKMHQRVKHAGLGPICDHCGRKFGNKFRLNEHLRSKHGYEKYKCALCDFQSAGTMAMRNHERRHRGEKPYVCEECGRRFHAAYLLAQHGQSHRTTKLYKCDLCPASFKANNSLHMHKRSCHSKTTYKCTLCERAYSCRQYAVKHIRSVHRYNGPVPSLEQTPS